MAEGPVGTLAYYEPWGNVVIYYGECGGANGLYELGEIIEGAEYILEMTKEVTIEVVKLSSKDTANEESTTESAAPPVSSETIAPPKQEPPTEIEPPSMTAPPTSNTPQTPPKEEKSVENIKITVENKTFTATLTENTATQAFVEMMKEAPVVINMSDHGGFEKVGSLASDLPTSNINTTTQAGDIVLYNGNQIVIFYGSNTCSYTSLGKIDDLSGWNEALGSGDVTVSFSIE